MRPRSISLRSFALLAALSVGRGAAGQAAVETPGWGRVALFGMWSRTTAPDAPGSDFSQVSASVTLRSPTDWNGGIDYGFDVRGAG